MSSSKCRNVQYLITLKYFVIIKLRERIWLYNKIGSSLFIILKMYYIFSSEEFTVMDLVVHKIRKVCLCVFGSENLTLVLYCTELLNNNTNLKQNRGEKYYSSSGKIHFSPC